MSLNAKGFALASGLLSGVALFAITFVAAALGIGNNLSHISAILIGYQVTYVGSAIGLIYGFVVGIIAGWLFASMYNGFGGRKA